MSTHDLVIANDTFPNFRSDLNAALAAIASQQSGTADPPAMYAYQLQARTDLGVIRRRNAANSGWIIFGALTEDYAAARSSDTILGTADHGRTVIGTSTYTQTITAAATLGDGWEVGYRNDGTGIITLDPNSTEQIDGATTLALHPGDSCRILCDGAGFKTVGLPRALKSGTVVATTSGTSHDFTIPSWAKKITLSFSGVSTNGTSNPVIQLGDAGGIETTGYVGSGGVLGAATQDMVNYTAGFGLRSSSAANVIHGSVTFTLLDPATFTWVASGVLSLSSSANTFFTSGSKALSAALTTVRLTMANGTDAFDAGAVNVLYE